MTVPKLSCQSLFARIECCRVCVVVSFATLVCAVLAGLIDWSATNFAILYTKTSIYTPQKKRKKSRSESEWKKGNMRGSTAGLAEGIIATPSTIHATFLVVLDVLFSSLIVAPAVINYWRGTWNLMAYVLFPNNMFLSAVASSVLAAIGNFVLGFCQEKFSRTFHPDKHRATFYIFSRFYSMVFGLISVNSWRGIWMLMDQYVPYKVSLLLLITGTSLLILALCKGLRNISSQPFGLSTDHSKGYFVIPTMFKSSVGIFGLGDIFYCWVSCARSTKPSTNEPQYSNFHKKKKKYFRFDCRNPKSPDFISSIVHSQCWSLDRWWWLCGEDCGLHAISSFIQINWPYRPGVQW